MWFLFGHAIRPLLIIKFITEILTSANDKLKFLLLTFCHIILLAKLVIRWVDITQLEKTATLLLPDMIKVSTRSSEHFFSVFLNITETFKLMEQLANIAMRQLLDNEGFEQDRSLPRLKKKSPKKVSALKR